MILGKTFKDERFVLNVQPKQIRDLTIALESVSLSSSKPDEKTTTYVMFGGNTKVSLTPTYGSDNSMALDVQTRGFFPRTPKYVKQIVKTLNGYKENASWGYDESSKIQWHLRETSADYNRTEIKSGIGAQLK